VLPPTHPIAVKYPGERYLSKVVIGTGSTIKDARRDAEKNAMTSFSEAIMSEVNSRYVSDSRSRYSSRGGSDFEKKVNSFVQISAKQVLTGVEEILGWDGYEEAKKYYFACFVLDKVKAGDLLYRMAREQYAALQEIQRRLQDFERVQQEEAERLSLDALKCLFEFKVLSMECLFFNRSLAELKDAKKLELNCLKTIYEAGKRRETSGSETDLEEALKFYQEASKHSPDKILYARILAVKRRLPCLECGRSGKCIQCDGKGGRWETCPHCHGSLQLTVTCPVCKGDGKRTCRTCNGTGKVSETCRGCNGSGRVTCPTCKGSGELWVKCATCYGSGKRRCMRCNGSGTVYGAGGRQYVCPDCGGNGYFVCGACNGTGKRKVKCSAQAVGGGEVLAEALGSLFSKGKRPQKYCNGTGQVQCPECRGTRRVPVACPECQGSGRVGACPRCQGAGQVTVRCNRCKNGQVWEKCSHCRGTGTCPVCGGKGHRP
jgi:tetratricopeptide (TPR) repeat protein